MTQREKTSTSRFMSLVLRHNPKAAGVTLDKNGWADVSALLDGMNRVRRTNVTLDDLKEVVETNDKQRFSFNGDETKIRANQGHSIYVDLELKESEPPAVLYHGTASSSVDSIKTDGLKPGRRLHVHLSTDKETAVKVGKRHGTPVVLGIDAAKMYSDGYQFFLSQNGVWLTRNVPAAYIRDWFWLS